MDAAAGREMTREELLEALKGSEAARLATEKKLAAIQAQLDDVRGKLTCSENVLAEALKFTLTEREHAAWRLSLPGLTSAEYAARILGKLHSQVAQFCEEAEVGRMKLAGCLQAAEGGNGQLQGVTKEHPYWSPTLEAIRKLREAAAMAVYLANQRVMRAKKFMEPETFAAVYYYATASHTLDWSALSPRVKEIYTQAAKAIQTQHSAAIEGQASPQGLEVEEILTEGNALSNAINALEELKRGTAYRKLVDLDRFLQHQFPTLSWEGEDSALDGPRRAIEALTVARMAFRDIQAHSAVALNLFNPPVPAQPGPSVHPHRTD